MTALENPRPSFWAGKRVLVTGHTGFKGAWLTLWLQRLGATVIGVSLPPATTPSLFELAGVAAKVDSRFADIRDAAAIAQLIAAAKPQIVFHLAAQALVRASYRDPLPTFATNVQGTANVLDALRSIDAARVAVAVTTDKVYRSAEPPFPHREIDPLGGHDPYSASKAAAEIVIASYRDAFLAQKGTAVASARAGNVIGGGDWSEDRLIPDAMRAWAANAPLSIRRPEAVRPWQHVLDPLAGYLMLAEKLWEQPALAGAYNFGPQTHAAATVREVVEIARAVNGGGEVTWAEHAEGPHESAWLALEVAKARSVLNVRPRWPLADAVRRTVRWYRQQLEGRNSAQLCAEDIDAFDATDVS